MEVIATYHQPLPALGSCDVKSPQPAVASLTCRTSHYNIDTPKARPVKRRIP